MATVTGKLRPLHDKVLVTDMEFGEQRSSGGIIVLGDDGKDRGIHPRWARVWAVGPEHKQDYNIGDWVLIEHGRWTRGIEYDDGGPEPITIRMIDLNCVIMWDPEKPNDLIIGELTGGGPPPTIRPEEFM